MYMATSIGIDTSTVTSAKTSTSSSDSSTSLDKDAFLQLLVTQMQYQDPLEPTDNTEYMSQLAQFSTVEELQNINDTFSANRSLSLAGQYVILNVPDSAGNISQVSGLVDYVTISSGKTYFSINDQYYDSDYLDSVVSLDYIEYLAKNSTTDSTEESTTGEAATENGETTTEENKTDGTEEV
jgi:flagellar basal-body rod modification protein FlgD